MRSRTGVTWLLVLVTVVARIANSQMNGSPKVEPKNQSQIVFVCEHGAALSVVSAAYFNKIAREGHLDLHAIARGIEPQKDLSASARQGLESDRVSFETKRPQKLSVKDARHARRVISFCALPPKYHTAAPVEMWIDVPPTGANYAGARDAILIHLRELIRQLKSEGTKQVGDPAEPGAQGSRKD